MGRARKSEGRASPQAAAAERAVEGTTERELSVGVEAEPSGEEGAKAPSFEASAERLSAIVEQLEGGELSLEQSLELFEEGVRVARAATRRLDAAERRVEELLGVDERGAPITRERDEQA